MSFLLTESVKGKVPKTVIIRIKTKSDLFERLSDVEFSLDTSQTWSEFFKGVFSIYGINADPKQIVVRNYNNSLRTTSGRKISTFLGKYDSIRPPVAIHICLQPQPVKKPSKIGFKVTKDPFDYNEAMSSESSSDNELTNNQEKKIRKELRELISEATLLKKLNAKAPETYKYLMQSFL